MQGSKRDINPFVVGGVLVFLLAVVLLVVSLMSVFRSNPYGNEVKIDNLAKEYPGLPQERLDLIYSQLYDMIAENLDSEGEIPKSGAIVRDGSAEDIYDNETKVHYGSFIVDIEAIRQSYRVQFEWSEVTNSQELGGYPAIILCLPKHLQIYDDFSKCRNAFAEVYFWQNEYQIDYSFGSATSYKIRKAIGDYLYNETDAYFVNITVDDGSLTKLRAQPDITYSFAVTTDEENVYQVIARADDLYGKKYIATLVSGDDIGNVAILLVADNGFTNMLSNWVYSVVGSDQVKILTDSL